MTNLPTGGAPDVPNPGIKPSEPFEINARTTKRTTTIPTTRMVFDRFILSIVAKKAHHIFIFATHIGVLAYSLPTQDFFLYSGYTCVGYLIYGLYMAFLAYQGYFGIEYRLPVQKYLLANYPLLRVIIEE